MTSTRPHDALPTMNDHGGYCPNPECGKYVYFQDPHFLDSTMQERNIWPQLDGPAIENEGLRIELGLWLCPACEQNCVVFLHHQRIRSLGKEGEPTARVVTTPTLAETLSPEEIDFLRLDARGLTGDADTLVLALISIRAGRWDQHDDTDFGDHTVPGAGQRQLMQHTLLAADELLPRVEALRAWALHGLHKHHGASHTEIADMLGVARATASSRWRALERKRPDMWDWARGEDLSNVCDTESVGIIVEYADGDILIADRTITPWGAACPAGHAEGHGHPAPKPGVPDQPAHRAAAVGELVEEVGLRARPEDLELVAHGWRDNRCGRELRPGAPEGHWWNIYRTRLWTGDVQVAPDEVTNARRVTPEQLQELVNRTIDFAHGRITEAAFRARPGAEPVWVRWLRDAGYVRVAKNDLDAVEVLAATPPANVTGV